MDSWPKPFLFLLFIRQADLLFLFNTSHIIGNLKIWLETFLGNPPNPKKNMAFLLVSLSHQQKGKHSEPRRGTVDTHPRRVGLGTLAGSEPVLSQLARVVSKEGTGAIQQSLVQQPTHPAHRNIPMVVVGKHWTRCLLLVA